MLKIYILIILIWGTTMTHAEDLFNRVKYLYTYDRIRPEHYPQPDGNLLISQQNSLIYSNLIGYDDYKDKNNAEFGVYEVTLNSEQLKIIEEMNSIFRSKSNEEYLNNKNSQYKISFGEWGKDSKWTVRSINKKFPNQLYVINDNYPEVTKNRLKDINKIINGFNQMVENNAIAKRISTLEMNNSVSFIKKDDGLEVVVSFKNIGDYNINITNPYLWREEPKTMILNNKKEYTCWYGFSIGGMYKDEYKDSHISLIPKYLNLDKIKISLSEDEENLAISPNETVYLYYFIPSNEIQFLKDMNDLNSDKFNFDFKLFDSSDYLSSSYLKITIGPFKQYFYWDYGSKDVNIVR